MKPLLDMRGRLLELNDRVVRALQYGSHSPFLDVTKITRIDNGKVYLADSKVPLKYPERLLIINELFKS